MQRIPSIQRFLSLICILIATAAHAEVITFDEILSADSNCCYLTTEYADLGVTFVTTDDGSIWGGLSNGNPGAWFLEGTNGPAFLGFNGSSFSSTMLFDTPITGFSLDMAPSLGWNSPDDVFTLEGTLDGVLVDRVTMPPLGFGEWMTVELVGDVDAVLMISEGPSFPNTFGVDNLIWEVAETPPQPEETDDPGEPPAAADLSVPIDVKPGHRHNKINVFSHGTTRVAVFGSTDFDVRSIDPESLQLGPGETISTKRARVKDVDHDGFLDLVAKFRTHELGLALGDSELCLSGSMFDGHGHGQTFEGCDSIDTVPRRKGWTHKKR